MTNRMQGRIIRSLSGFYGVAVPGGTVTCKARGILRRQRITPLTGDIVEITADGENGVLESILPRKNSFVRPAVSNVDTLVVFASGVNPVTDPFLIDRVAAIALSQNVGVVLCINKGDMNPAQHLADIYIHAGFPVIRTSAITGEGITALRDLLRGKVSALTGNSGVGKSSVLNCLCPSLALPTGEVSSKLGRGRHTTRHVELYNLGEETYVADTPGFSSFDTDQMDIILTEGLPLAFPEFGICREPCQFRDCTHRKEPGCAVRRAVSEGRIEKTRYDSYLHMYEQTVARKTWDSR